MKYVWLMINVTRFSTNIYWNRYLRLSLVDQNPDVESIKITQKELYENKLLRDQLEEEHRNVKAQLKEIQNATSSKIQKYNNE